MEFDANNIGFGRQESFGLRYGWLTKGTQAFLDDSSIFERDDATVTLGVGRNMVKSIKYWLQALGVLQRNKRSEYELSELGDYIFGRNGHDVYLEDDATLWLLHWSLCNNPESATVFYWFFNCYHRAEFDIDNLYKAISVFLDENADKTFAEKTIRQDIGVLLRMYTHGKGKRDEHRALESPFNSLRLLSYYPDEKVYRSKLTKRSGIPLSVFGYAVVEFMQMHESKEMPVEKMMYSKDTSVTLGAVFRLSEEGLMYMLDRLIEYVPGIFEYRNSAGLRQLYMMKDVNSLEMLRGHYEAGE